MLEIWQDIDGYEGFYQVSNLGHIKSLDRMVVCKKHFGNVECLIKGKAMATTKGKDGYAYIHLSKDHKGKYYKVHRLVAKAFIPNPDNLPCINHKDEIRTNNSADNLEWCSYAYNNSYGNHLEKISKALTGIKRSDETRRKMSEAHKGKPVSEATRKKLSELNTGEKNPNYGLKRSQETLEKMRLARQGFKMPGSAKIKLREAALRQWERKRASQEG